MTLFEAIARRYSYRGPYLPAPVPREALRSILEAGLAAPSGCNLQTTRLIGIDDPRLAQAAGGLIHKNFGSAPAAIGVLTEPVAGYADRYFNVQDYAAAIENMLLAITALGYASCWVEGQVTSNPQCQAELAKLLKIPSAYTLAAYLPVGLAAEQAPPRPQFKSFEERVSFNGF